MTGNRHPIHESRRGPSNDEFRHAGGRTCLVTLFLFAGTLASLLSLGGSGWSA